jgi:hypothetical protein
LGVAAEDCDSWALTAGILPSKVLFSVTKGPDCDFKLCNFSKELKYTA